MTNDSPTRYGSVSRLLHWGMAALIGWQMLKFFDRIDDGEQAAFAAANEFSWSGRYADNSRDWSFTDLFDHRFTSYTYHFIWCCYAIAWGIAQYDREAAPCRC